jgi:hypothetical protein
VLPAATADAGDMAGQQQPTQPVTTNLKPATLESLGTGAAAERQRTAALAAAQASSVRPRQLASAVQGACLTVTGSSGQRVYCQLDAARPKGEGALPAAAAGTGTAGGVLGGRGLLAQPIEVLLDQLADKRRQVRAVQLSGSRQHLAVGQTVGGINSTWLMLHAVNFISASCCCCTCWSMLAL